MADRSRYLWGGYVPESIALRTRTREAIREIRRLPIEATAKKKLLATWFQLHERAAVDEGAKRRAYLQLLGESFYRKLRG